MTARTISYMRLAFAFAAVLMIVAWCLALMGCHARPLMVVTDHTPALIAPHVIAEEQNAKAQTSVRAAATQVAMARVNVSRLSDLLAQSDAGVRALATSAVRILDAATDDLRDAAQQLADSEQARAEAEAVAVEFAKSDVQSQQLRASDQARIKHLEDDYWSVRQHRQATIIKVLVGIFGVVSVVASLYLGTHPAANWIVHGVLSLLTLGIHPVVMWLKWMGGRLWKGLKRLMAPRVATPGTPVPAVA